MLVRGASLLLRCSHRAAARPRSLGGSGFSRQRVGMAASRTQAASEAAHCWNVAKRWEGFLLQDGTEEGSVPVHLISPAEVASLEDPHGAAAAALAGLNSFKGKSGELLLVPDAQVRQQGRGQGSVCMVCMVGMACQEARHQCKLGPRSRAVDYAHL